MKSFQHQQLKLQSTTYLSPSISLRKTKLGCCANWKSLDITWWQRPLPDVIIHFTDAYLLPLLFVSICLGCPRHQLVQHGGPACCCCRCLLLSSHLDKPRMSMFIIRLSLEPIMTTWSNLANRRPDAEIRFCDTEDNAVLYFRGQYNPSCTERCLLSEDSHGDSTVKIFTSGQSFWSLCLKA